MERETDTKRETSKQTKDMTVSQSRAKSPCSPPVTKGLLAGGRPTQMPISTGGGATAAAPEVPPKGERVPKVQAKAARQNRQRGRKCMQVLCVYDAKFLNT